MISTPKGDLDFVIPDDTELVEVASAWPAGVCQTVDDDDEHAYGFIFQHGDNEVWGVKLQQVDRSEEQALGVFNYNRFRVATAAAEISGRHKETSMIVGSYLRPAGFSDSTEVGIVAFPMFLGDQVPQNEEDQGHAFFEVPFPGCGAMIEDFVTSIPNVEGDEFVDIDFRPRNAMPRISLDFLIAGDQLTFLEKVIEDDDPRWKILADAGHEALFHMPAFPMAEPAPVQG